MAPEFNKKVYFEWCVELPSPGYSLESPVFIVRSDECSLRFLCVNQNWTCYYNFYLELRSKRTEFKSCTGHLQVGFKREQALSLDNKAFEISQPGSKEIWYISNDKLQSKLPPDYLDGNRIKFLLFFDSIDEPVLKISKEPDDKSAQISSYKDACYLLDNLSRDFGKLLDEGPNHDVEFTCGDQTVKAHKNILCCRSSVFASMLQSDMVEGKTGRINIKDIDATIFQQFLRSLYTGMLPELTVDSAFHLYEASDKYCVDAMKKQCADFLTDNLSPENACEILVLSDRHSDADFKQNVISYVIKENIPYLGQKWTDFCDENPVLAVEVYKLLCEQFRTK